MDYVRKSSCYESVYFKELTQQARILLSDYIQSRGSCSVLLVLRRMTRVTVITRMTEMTGVAGMTRITKL